MIDKPVVPALAMLYFHGMTTADAPLLPAASGAIRMGPEDHGTTALRPLEAGEEARAGGRRARAARARKDINEEPAIGIWKRGVTL
ncbi:hypothetical protein HT136_13455 [Novosphingobium profundi]|uniref:hypothetical protein n=1 Tax=Novosphingobium profundi TaxID=1774954 RepID=UPI001BDA1F3A|nr:hypothetical protein [Novosphingobium profundi]MBT0669372.1 hypothetical protein [Novosphingobium profundi]